MTDPDLSERSIEPTKETYDQFQEAYAYFNRALFEGQLPNCLITLQRNKRSYGYFCGDRFGRADGLVTDEIALNPRYFHVRPVADVLSTLVHEMEHLWQHHCGKPGRGGYHNREWAQRMKAIGLHPSSTGKEGGQETGDSVSHYIVSAGPFEVAANELLMTGFAIAWTEKPPETDTAPVKGGEGPDQEPKSGKRVKYTCPCCRLNAWAKHRVQLVCGRDMTPMEPAG
jgi:hypothetical protein